MVQNMKDSQQKLLLLFVDSDDCVIRNTCSSRANSTKTFLICVPCKSCWATPIAKQIFFQGPTIFPVYNIQYFRPNGFHYIYTIHSLFIVSIIILKRNFRQLKSGCICISFVVCICISFYVHLEIVYKNVF